MAVNTTQIIESTDNHTATIILLHGRGSNALEFKEDFFSALCEDGRTLRERLPQVKWVLPSAPARYSTVFDEELTEWFDIYSLTDPEAQQELQLPGLQESLAMTYALIERESEIVPTDRIFLGGMSQGCATTVLAYLFGGIHLAGFIGLSGWMPFRTQISQLSSDRSSVDPLCLFVPQPDVHVVLPDLRDGATRHRSAVLLCHGLDDPIVDVNLGRLLRDTLRMLGHNVQWRADTDCDHWIKEPEAVERLAVFIDSNVTAKVLDKCAAR